MVKADVAIEAVKPVEAVRNVIEAKANDKTQTAITSAVENLMSYTGEPQNGK
jgi:hypothetical protein